MRSTPSSCNCTASPLEYRRPCMSVSKWVWENMDTSVPRLPCLCRRQYSVNRKRYEPAGEISPIRLVLPDRWKHGAYGKGSLASIDNRKHILVGIAAAIRLIPVRLFYERRRFRIAAVTGATSPSANNERAVGSGAAA